MTREQLDDLVWRLITGMYAGNLKPPQVAGAIMHAADQYAAGAAHRAALETALSSRPRAVHWQVHKPASGPACGAAGVCTTARARVSCGPCMDTAAWKAAA